MAATLVPTVTLGDLEDLLADHGIMLDQVLSVELVAEHRGDRTSPLRLRVRRFLLDATGHRFVVRSGNGLEPATESVIIPLEH